MSLDKFSIKLLQHLCSEYEKPSSYLHSFHTDDLENIAKCVNSDSESVRSAVKYLHEQEYLNYACDSKTGKERAFYLSHKGLNYKYFRRKEIMDYIAEKWIDFFSMLLSVISIIISTIALLK
nr:hypothetical protein [uncultured Anaerotignum sp.]